MNKIAYPPPEENFGDLIVIFHYEILNIRRPAAAFIASGERQEPSQQPELW
jgi:hypothetical protein